jgi:hypothetical protein
MNNEQAYRCQFVCSQCGPRVVLIYKEIELEECAYCDRFAASTITAQTIQPFGEREWLSCMEWDCMTQWIDNRFGPRLADRNGTYRKFRLFAALCCRFIWQEFADESFRQAVEIAEAYAEGLATESDRKRAWRNAHTVGWKVGAVGVHWATINAVGDQPFARFFPHYVIEHSNKGNESELVAHWLLDIFGNPFRPVAHNPTWLTSTAVSLAGGIYADRAFDRLPILADALEDAGCSDEAILGHLRGPGPHVAGCWAVDLILGKE